MVGEPSFEASDSSSASCVSLLGPGQVQVVRDHPSWKHSMHGIVALADTDIPTNLALYLTESEQRAAVLLTDVKISPDNRCEHAMALLVESLPGVGEGTLEKCIENVRAVQSKGLASYLASLASSSSQETYPSSSSQNIIPVSPVSFRMEEVLHSVLDDCFSGMGETEGPRGDGIRFSKTPRFHCQCNVDRVYRALSLLPKQDVAEILAEGKDVESTCGFCGKAYSVSVQDLTQRLVQPNGDSDII
jgi:molecular chaperone Hsp33